MIGYVGNSGCSVGHKSVTQPGHKFVTSQFIGRQQTFVELQLRFKLHFYTKKMQFNEMLDRAAVEECSSLLQQNGKSAEWAAQRSVHWSSTNVYGAPITFQITFYTMKMQFET